MVLYEVNLSIDASVYDDYLQWLKLHIAEILKINGFVGAKTYFLQEDTHQVIVVYKIKSQADLTNYLENHAAHFRQDALNRFGEKVKATRRILVEQK